MARKVKVATISMALECRKPKNRQDNLDYISQIIAEITPIKPDLICLPEVFPIAGLDEREKILGPGKELLLEVAKKYQTYIVGSLYEEREGKLYNTALVVNRSGEIVGRYDKIHPTENELQKHIIPGKKNQLPVDTEFGKIGIQICFDANWPEDWQRQVENGAEIIIFCSAFPGGRILNSIAVLNKVYIVSSIWSLHSGIIDNTGEWIVKTDRFSWWVSSIIDLERTVFHWDWQGDKTKKICRKYRDKVKVKTFGQEAWFVLEPNSPHISIPELIKEFNLVTYRDYIKRATKAQRKAR